MASKLPVISGHQLIRFLKRLGYRVVRQRGSHIKLEYRKNGEIYHITIPNRPELAKGTLNDILNAVSRHTGIQKGDLRKKLSNI